MVNAAPHIVQYRTEDGVLHDLPPTEPKTLVDGYSSPRGPSYVAVVHDLARYDAGIRANGGHHLGAPGVAEDNKR